MIPISSKPILPVLHTSVLSDDELDTYAQEKIDKLTGNPNYPDMASFPEEQAMAEALTAYRNALAAADDGNSVDTEDKNVKRELLEDSLLTLAIRCGQIAAGDLVKFHSSGFETRKPAEPIGKPDKPEEVEATDGTLAGSIQLTWKPVDGAVVYFAEMTESPQNAATWQLVHPEKNGASTKSETLVGALTSGKRYWFRIAGFNAAGLGAWSDAATRIAQ